MPSVRKSRAAINPNVANILKTYYHATPDEIVEGLNWYAQASSEAIRRLPEYTPEQALGIVAALSPQTPWMLNIHYAERFADTGNGSTAQRLAVARDIRDGADPEERLGGQKVRAFYHCLCDQTVDDVCVDGHAYAVWMGVRVFTSKVKTITPKQYAIISEDYRTAAAIAGIAPHQMQAITWVTWRRIHKVKQYKDPGSGRVKAKDKPAA